MFWEWNKEWVVLLVVAQRKLYSIVTCCRSKQFINNVTIFLTYLSPHFRLKRLLWAHIHGTAGAILVINSGKQNHSHRFKANNEVFIWAQISYNYEVESSFATDLRIVHRVNVFVPFNSKYHSKHSNEKCFLFWINR